MRNISKKLYSLYHPEQYHGWGKKKQYFEGWYYKIINKKGDRAFAIIPGIAMDADGSSHSFIQLMDGKKNTSSYQTFAASDFNPDSKKFNLRIGASSFSADQISLDIKGCKGSLNFINQVPWPVKWNSPGIMGPYAFVPFMECYHGILSMDHSISGELTIDGELIDFTGGRGYMEKDWGESFPSAYIWMQTNHFAQEGASFKLSVANIPWMRSSFVGFIAGLWFKDQLIRFTTYNSSSLLKSYVDEKEVIIKLKNRKYELEVIAKRAESTELASPILGFMNGKINESMTSELQVKLQERKTGKVVFEDTGINAGLEVAGNLEEILLD